MTGMAGYPGAREGWGRLILEYSLWFEGDAQRILPFDLRNANGLLTAETKDYFIPGQRLHRAAQDHHDVHGLAGCGECQRREYSRE